MAHETLYDNKSAIHIAHNPIQHDSTRHIEVNRHFIKEMLDNVLVSTPYMPSSDPLANDLTRVYLFWDFKRLQAS